MLTTCYNKLSVPCCSSLTNKCFIVLQKDKELPQPEAVAEVEAVVEVQVNRSAGPSSVAC